MKVFILLFPVLFGTAAKADIILPATLNVICKSTSDARTIKIVSDKHGSVVLVDEKEILRQEQLIAGTEGGPAYVQAVGGGYNITISGGDFEKAFNETTIKNGEAPASVWDAKSNKSVDFICKGSFSF